MALNGTWLTQFPIKPCGSVNFRVIQRSAAISAMSAFCKILLPCISKFSYKPLLLQSDIKKLSWELRPYLYFFWTGWSHYSQKIRKKFDRTAMTAYDLKRSSSLYVCFIWNSPANQERIDHDNNYPLCWLSLPVTAVCVTFTVTLSKIKIKTLQYIKSRIREMKGGKYIKPSLRFRSMQFFIRNIP